MKQTAASKEIAKDVKKNMLSAANYRMCFKGCYHKVVWEENQNITG